MSNRKLPNQDDKVSDEELARFLKNLSHLYRDRKIGNPPLANALFELAQNLKELPRAPSDEILPVLGKRVSIISPNFEKLKNLDAKIVEQILADNTKTKAELIELAWARFSIARGKLLKSNVDTVRQAIRSALSHERSLKIIMQEAHKRGAQRSS